MTLYTSNHDDVWYYFLVCLCKSRRQW